MKSIEKQTPARIIALDFMAVTLAGSFLLVLPVCVKPGVSLYYADALFTSTSAVCVAGLIAVGTVDMYAVLGQAIVAFLIQVGGLGVTSVGVGMILALGRRVNLRGRLLIKEAMNLGSGKGIVCIVKNVLKTTLCLGGAGAVLSYLVFSRNYPPLKALRTSLFHSMATSSNSGSDTLEGLQNLTGYKDNIPLNLTTSGLIVFGSLGFLVVMDTVGKRSLKELCLHSKAVVVTTLTPLAVGTVLLRPTEDIAWLGVFFTSVSARTAEFATFPLSNFTTTGLLTVTVLMFIGAPPGSTGGGIKTSTLFTLLHAIKGAVTNTQLHAFHYKIPQEAFYKVTIVTALPSLMMISGILCMYVLELGFPFEDIMLEITSAFGIVGLSTGITPGLSPLSKLLEVLIMYVGGLGPLTTVTIWIFKSDTPVSFPEGNISIE